MLYLSAHNARAVVAAWLLAAALAAVAARIAFPVDLAVFLPPRDVPLIELLAAVFAGVAAGLSAPKAVEWEKLGGGRVAVWSALTALAVPAMAVLAAVAVLVRVGAGAIAAPVLTTLLFLGCCVMQNTLPEWRAGCRCRAPTTRRCRCSSRSSRWPSPWSRRPQPGD